MRGIYPLYAALGAILCIVISVFLAPVFPVPLSTILYWAGWIAALLFVVAGIVWIARPTRRL